MLNQESTGRTTFIGTSNFFLIGVEDFTFWMFQFAFAATSATIVAGTLAERCQMAAYLCYSLILTGFVYPVVVHSIWSTEGFLSANRPDPLWDVGFIDFAGSTVVHFTGGFTALIATYLLGPRRGRFYDARGRLLVAPNPMPGHSSALQVRDYLLLMNIVFYTDDALILLVFDIVHRCIDARGICALVRLVRKIT
jgi:Amt family ammonium transporter